LPAGLIRRIEKSVAGVAIVAGCVRIGSYHRGMRTRCTHCRDSADLAPSGPGMTMIRLGINHGEGAVSVEQQL
jgi:hypothetical protein